MHFIDQEYARWLLRRARELWDEKGYIPMEVAALLRQYGHSKPELELQFSLGAQA